MIGSKIKGGVDALNRVYAQDEKSHGGVETLRCSCGRLLARVLKSAIELKCARCKRVVILVGGRRFEEVGAARCVCLEDVCREAARKE